MCTPIIAAVAIVGATVASTAVAISVQSAAASSQAQVIKQQGQAQQAVANYNAEATQNAAEFNASTLEKNSLIYEEAAIDSVARGVELAAERRAEFRRANARGRATLGSSGTVLDTGTNLQLLVENAGFGEINALAEINNAEREAYGYKQESANLLNQAEGVKYTGDLEAGSIKPSGDAGLAASNFAAANTKFAGKLDGISSAVGGISSLANNAPNLFPNTFQIGGG